MNSKNLIEKLATSQKFSDAEIKKIANALGLNIRQASGACYSTAVGNIPADGVQISYEVGAWGYTILYTI